MKRIDLTGQRFGKLIALEPDLSICNSKNKKRTTWKCKCDCGNIVTITTDALRSGKTKSCGCLKGIDYIIGEKFGRLTVIEKLQGGQYLCKCDCGNYTVVKTSNLKGGNTKSCGCLQKERTSESNYKSLIGQKFGKLTVVKRVENNKHGHVCYLCQCDCGGQTIVERMKLKNGTTSSCGCIKSKGEEKINHYLTKNKILFKTQYNNEQMKLSSGYKPLFDFAIFNKDKLVCLIEYNGIQHYSFSNTGWNTEENFIKTKKRDSEKLQICKDLNIPLYIIPYWDFDKIDSILSGIIKENTNIENMSEDEIGEL